jgi:hypothetical protein
MSDDLKGYPTLFRPVSMGQGISAAEHNAILDALNRRNTGVAKASQVSNLGDTADGISFRRFKIETIAGDYLVCLAWDGTTTSTLTIGETEFEERVSIARPPLLRTSLLEHNDVTFVYTDDTTRTASATGETDETQVIVPAYVVDDEIYAMRDPTGGTGVIDDGDGSVEWIDLNLDARAWAKQAA